jgi:integrase
MLTEPQVRTAQPTGKSYKLFDANGLFLLVAPNGSRHWRLRYRYGGREKLLSLGAYPLLSLREARERRDELRRQLSAGTDPAVDRKLNAAERKVTFGEIAQEWLDLRRKKFAPATLEKAEWTFRDLINPLIGTRPITEISAPELLLMLRRLEKRGKNETAHRTQQRCGQVFRFAIATGRAQRDPTQDLRGALAPIVSKHHPAVTEPAKVGELMRAVHGYVGYPTTQAALKLAALLFVRPGELRKAEWSEFDPQRAEWRIPAAKMKMREPHIVPLSRQSLQVLRELHDVTGHGRYVFPCPRSATRPMSENTLTAALRRMGYTGDEMTWHGFRTMASTTLNEHGWPPDVIELQLAHTEQNEVRAAYNRAQHLDERRTMMQWWADHLDQLRTALAASPSAAWGADARPAAPIDHASSARDWSAVEPRENPTEPGHWAPINPPPIRRISPPVSSGLERRDSRTLRRG